MASLLRVSLAINDDQSRTRGTRRKESFFFAAFAAFAAFAFLRAVFVAEARVRRRRNSGFTALVYEVAWTVELAEIR